MRHLLVMVTAALLAVACSDDDAPATSRIEGGSGTLGTGQVSSYVQTDSSGTMTDLVLMLPMASIDSASGNASVFLELPAQAAPFRHLGVNFEPAGHPPGPYQVPHFDLHFYMITDAERQAIDCTAEPMPAADRIPAPYLIPGTGTEATNGTCVPQMGVHAVDPTSPELSPTDPQPFTRTLILGYHDGALAFVEPMVTQAYLQTRTAFSFNVPRPQVVGREIRWPTKLDATYDAGSSAYRITLSGFQTVR